MFESVRVRPLNHSGYETNIIDLFNEVKSKAKALRHFNVNPVLKADATFHSSLVLGEPLRKIPLLCPLHNTQNTCFKKEPQLKNVNYKQI